MYRIPTADLFLNILNDFRLLERDFTGIVVNPAALVFFAKTIFITILFFIAMYFFGEKIRKVLIGSISNMYEDFFLNIALGYIFLSTIIAILGTFSLFNSGSLIILQFVVTIIAFYPFTNIYSRFKNVFTLIVSVPLFSKKNIVTTAVLLFVAIGILKLIAPEIGVDAIAYHTSYPHLYVQNKTMMIGLKGSESYATVPQLGEMMYVLTYFLGVMEAARYIHFIFYFLCILLLSYICHIKINNFLYPPLLLVTSSVAIQFSSSAYTDFQWVFCWILLFFLLTKEKEISRSNFILGGILFGGILSTKIWTISFLPGILLFLLISQKKTKRFYKLLLTFLCISLLIPLIWYIRAYMLIGNPFYPNFEHTNGSSYGARLISLEYYLRDHLSMQHILFRIRNIVNLSPLAIIGVFLFFVYSFSSLKKFRFTQEGLFTTTICMLYLVLPYFYYSARYLLIGFIPLIIYLYASFPKSKISTPIIRYALPCVFIILFCYYFIGAILVLPYGLGWADKNKYLSRILSRDNSSYYDYENRFSKFISSKDIIATYDLYGFYYTQFTYKDSAYFLENNEKDFDIFKRNGATKLLIKHGGVTWFCKKVGISDCDPAKYLLLAFYEPAQQYLYELK